MSSLFSGKSKSATSSSTSVDKKDALPPTNEVFTSPPAGAEPKKKWYDQGQQKQVSYCLPKPRWKSRLMSFRR